jgi:hypothetical protein
MVLRLNYIYLFPSLSVFIDLTTLAAFSVS